MEKYNKESVVTNYYTAQNAIMNIGIMEDIPEELHGLCINASVAISKIVDYINKDE